MSGGHWDYIQYRFTDVIEDIEKLIKQNGKLKTNEELKDSGWKDVDWYEKYPEDKYHYKFTPDIIKEFKEAIPIIKKSQVYIQRIDWLLSGDDGEQTFLERLGQDLKKEGL
ncbi:hypothetical protein [Flavobacterium sp.]|uniref:hypothetical protein n=1 Tax=Flavobacterium sp. TaxID=239 RepID=UPI0025DC60CD|nr:hypothetical protein [Flavobacterium sp.]